MSALIGAAPEIRQPDSMLYECIGLGENRESDLAPVDHLEQFLLELGRDFCSIARQFRITSGNRH